jgi:hypothetical protein
MSENQISYEVVMSENQISYEVVEKDQIKYKVTVVNISELENADWQPKRRTQGINALKALGDNIGKNGLIYPPIVVKDLETGKLTISDGHRRVAACRDFLGWDKMPVIIREGDPAEIFAAVNSSTMSISALDNGYISLAGGKVSNKKVERSIDQIREAIGDDGLRQMIDSGMSPQVMDTVNRFLRYIGYEKNSSSRAKVLYWFMKYKCVMDVKHFITGENKIPVRRIKSVFEQDQPPIKPIKR